MKYKLPAVLVLFSWGLLFPSGQQVRFEDHFINATMRIDYHHIWDGTGESIILDNIYREGEWPGNRAALKDPFNYGRYRIKVYSVTDHRLIYSNGFDSYFGEYKTTGDAAQGIKKSFHETALIPFPLNKVTFTIESFSNKGEASILFSAEIDPGTYPVIYEKKKRDARVISIHDSGDPSEKADIAIVAEGYTRSEEEKAVSDFAKVIDIFFSQEPYRSMKDKFNIYGIFEPSGDSGTDEPRIGKYRNTVVDTTFNSLGSARYLLTESNRKLRDLTSLVPCDAVMIMVNSTRYGGGGIYNSFCTFTIDHEQTPYLILHEFGHSFSGLADEYYSSSTAYNEFYPRGTEPAEPNITAFPDPPAVKWSHLIREGTPLPTEWMKKEFDRMNIEFGQKREALNRKVEELSKSGAPREKIREAEKDIETLMKEKDRENNAFFKRTGMSGVVGVFEGAGYSSEGLFRSMADCIMFTIGKKPYCMVCEDAVRKMISKYSTAKIK